MPTILQLVQYAGFVGAQLTNSLCLYLIYANACANFGRYRVMMIMLNVCSMFYSYVHLLTQPVMHIQGAGILFFPDSFDFVKFDNNIGICCCVMYCGSYTFCLAIFTTHFIYRYLAVCHPPMLTIFDGPKVYWPMIPALASYVVYGGAAWYGFTPLPWKNDYYREVLKNVYNHDIEKHVYLAPIYFTRDTQNHRIWFWPSIIGGLCGIAVEIVCFAVIIVCASKTYAKLSSIAFAMSARTKTMNRQLFLMLTLQTILPTVTMYIPIAVGLTFPLFEIEIGQLANSIGCYLSIYPAMEPLIAIFVLKPFREAVLSK
ncbi:unnamed protein product [Caenorhabditis bovis]|uniref:Serpentine receptor class r-10 n=1 Tax=Caenorhabditis bovis TaxID=2654633 RepID=A0A8S1EF11_9PELO|nr:unnamed protein product [Caenorhabditis bovis]